DLPLGGAMDFALSDKMKDLLGRIEEFLRREVFPRERELLAKGQLYGDEPAIRSLRDQVKQLGMWTPQVPKELGGMGLPLVEHGLVSEALGRSPLGHFLFGCQAPDAGNIEILHKYGTQEQQARWLTPLLAGEIRSCFSMTEPDTPG